MAVSQLNRRTFVALVTETISGALIPHVAALMRATGLNMMRACPGVLGLCPLFVRPHESGDPVFPSVRFTPWSPLARGLTVERINNPTFERARFFRCRPGRARSARAGTHTPSTIDKDTAYESPPSRDDKLKDRRGLAFCPHCRFPGRAHRDCNQEVSLAALPRYTALSGDNPWATCG